MAVAIWALRACHSASVGSRFSAWKALIVVRSLLAYVSRHGYALFGWWRLAVGIVGLAALYIWG